MGNLTSNYASLQGEFWLAERNALQDINDDGLVVPNVGMNFMGNVPKADILMKRDSITHKESFTGKRTIDLKQTRVRGAMLAMRIEDRTVKHNLKLIFQGRSNRIDTGSVTNAKLLRVNAVAPTYTVVNGLPTVGQTYVFGARNSDGDWVPYRNLATSGLAIKDSSGTPKTLTQGTNYVVQNWRNGTIKFIDLTTGGAYAGPIKGDFSFGAVTDTLNQNITFGTRYPLTYPNVSNVVIKDSAGTPVTVNASYYTIYPEEGAIEFLRSQVSAFDAAAYVMPLKVTFTANPSNHIAMLQTKTDPEYWVRYKGIDTLNNDRLVLVDLYRVSFEQSGGMPLIDDEIGGQDLNGECLFDITKDPDGPMGQVGRYVYLD
jgi:hypothetical protein